MSIALDPERHRELVSSLSDSVTAISEQLDALETAAGDQRPRWSGAARLAYDRAHCQLTSSMETVRNALDGAIAAAADSAEALVRANRDITAIWQ